jgi:hypothetical protein
MTRLTLPRELTGAACYREDPQVRRFDPTLPLTLRAWCRRRGAGCEGHRLLRVVLTNFRLPPHQRTMILVEQLLAVLGAALAVQFGTEPALIYAPDDAELRVFGDPAPPTALNWQITTLMCQRTSSGCSLPNPMVELTRSPRARCPIHRQSRLRPRCRCLASR